MSGGFVNGFLSTCLFVACTKQSIARRMISKIHVLGERKCQKQYVSVTSDNAIQKATARTGNTASCRLNES